MNLKKYREKNNIPDGVVVIDAESMLLSLLMRDKAFGYALSEDCICAYHNAVVDYFAERGIPVVFTYLGEDNARLCEEKQLGLHYGTKMIFTDEEVEAINNQAKQSPCINVCRDGDGFEYQLDPAIIAERYNPSMYNGAIKKWSGSSYYTYLMEKLAPDYTVDSETRRDLKACAQEFCVSTLANHEMKYLDSYVTSEADKLQADESAREPDEAKAIKFFKSMQNHVADIIEEYTPV